MSIDTVVIIIFGLSATVFMLTFAWWLWTRAPMPSPVQSHHMGPPLGPPTDSPQWMGWSDPSAAPAPPSPERVEFESSTLEPVGELRGEGDGDMDKARTMFFMKKPADSTQILTDDLEFLIPSAEDEAPAHYDEQTQTAPMPRTKAKRRRPPPPPPPRH